jgi:hypothetical protein
VRTEKIHKPLCTQNLWLHIDSIYCTRNKELSHTLTVVPLDRTTLSFFFWAIDIGVVYRKQAYPNSSYPFYNRKLSHGDPMSTKPVQRKGGKEGREKNQWHDSMKHSDTFFFSSLVLWSLHDVPHSGSKNSEVNRQDNILNVFISHGHMIYI